MRFQTPLVPARLIRRYKRFLADITLEGSGAEVTAHCANPGSMMGLAEPKKKLKYGWRLVDHENGHFTGVDTSLPNRALKAVINARGIPELAAYETVRPEQKYGENSRIDFLLQQAGLPDAYVEVKSVTLSRQSGLAEFPDSVTARGTKHLGELAQMTREGHRAVLFYLVQRTDCECVSVASDIDPTYAKALADAKAAGVEVLAYGTQITPEQITLAGRLALA